ncbi:MAG: N-acetylmuramoyl-L-alanine amidase [Oscillospiraceae bacterium]|nr:N-acetylmuramoyl-L-alanine amidase [Oscillospiraceae bacterium]
MFLTLRIRKSAALALTLLFFLLAALMLHGSRSIAVFHTQSAEKTVYVLDAGHGGEDGGAVSEEGVRESDINLSVTLRLDALLRFLGRDTVLTRTGDAAIYSSEAQTIREKKVSDLKNRVAIVNSTPGAVLVSIHQNSLPSVPGVHGAQAFYGMEPLGDTLAASVQEALNQGVNINNAKHEKLISSTIYLMKNVKCPAVLVECGFMSNRDESVRLLDGDYQRRLATAIAAGLLNAKETESDAA